MSTRTAVNLDRLPPHALEAEQGALGCCLLSPNDSLGLCVEKLASVEAFYDLRHQCLYETLLGMYNERQPIDVVTVQQKLKDAGTLEGVGGLVYLSTLQDVTPSAANLGYYLEILREKHTLRRALKACTDVISRVHEHEGEVDELLDGIERDILAIRAGDSEASEPTPKDLARAAIDRIQHLHQHQGELRGLPTSLGDLDRVTGGLKPGNMIVIAARPSKGKTALAMQMAEAAASRAQPVAVGVFSLEMDSASITDRRLIHESGVSGTDIEEGRLTEQSMKLLTKAAGSLARRSLFLDDRGGLSVLQIAAKARRWHQKHKLGLIVVDYLQLCTSSSRKAQQSRQVEVAEVSAALKGLAKELSVPVVVLSQLNRECEETNKAGLQRTPTMSDLRESGAVEQDADLILLMYSESETRKEPREVPDGCRPVNVFVAKQRNGRSSVTIQTIFDPAKMRFSGVSRVDVQN